MYDSIIILGATATGKTKISIELAKRLNTEIINADSMYIYKDLTIGTAKPTKDEMQGIKHHIIDVAEASEDFNVIDFRNIAKVVVEDFINRKILPIAVGGTGFYIDSLISNYSYGSATHSDKIRNELEEELQKFGKEHLYNKLQSISPNSASKLHPNDTVRVIRALEICLQNNTSIIEHKNDEEPLLKKPLLIGLTMDRESLYNKINLRVDLMIKNGLIDEVKKLYDLGYRPETHQSMKGIGYKEIVDYFEGIATLDVAVEKLKQHTRNYAKRQITWFKRNKDIHWFDIEKDSDIVNQIIELYNK
jgi:tRNA dimethylallyltransferase